MTEYVQGTTERRTAVVAPSAPSIRHVAGAVEESARTRRPGLRIWWSRTRVGRYGDLTRPGLIAALVMLALVAMWAVAPGLFTSQDPNATDVANALTGPSLDHLFGTDVLGRDVFSRFVHGTSATMSAAVGALAIGFVASVVLGLLAGYLGGWVDELIMRVIDILMSLPSLLIALMLMTALGFGTMQIAVAVGIASIASFSRVMRAEVLKARRREFVTAARTSGLPSHVVLRRHVLPHAVGPVLALTALELGAAILAISALSFLGYGTPPPAPEWGSMIDQGRQALAQAWWMTTLPGLGVLLVVLAVNRASRCIERVTA